MPRYIDADALKARMLSYYGCVNENTAKENYRGETLMNYEVADMIEDCIDNAPTADVVEVENVSDQIIRKKAEVRDYWLNDVKRYRAAQGYADIETAVDNFLRGYGEAVEDMLAILDEERISRDGS